MHNAAPEPARFTARLAELHRQSTSPNDMFGFEVTTCDGKLPHTVAWEKSWATFFGKLLRGVLKLDTEVNGVWPELEAAAEQVINAVIPRLLGVLQADGRELKPSLIHGDCWEATTPNADAPSTFPNINRVLVFVLISGPTWNRTSVRANGLASSHHILGLSSATQSSLEFSNTPSQCLILSLHDVKLRSLMRKLFITLG
ncbi:hypothetical protein P7C71_g2110, partial [Lecanoromycetidae sp. Uapishka_2]